MGGTTVHELIQQWLSENGVSWKKKLAARTGCCESRADELLPPTVETLFAVLQRGRLDLVAFVRNADPASLVAKADVRSLAIRHGLDVAGAHATLAAIAPGVLEVARKTVRTDDGVERMLQNGASANEIGAIGDLANRLYRQHST